jgi:protein AroM
VKLGLVTIGQSPRDDVVASMFGEVGAGMVIEAGALDALDEAEIARLAPAAEEHPLVTRLRDGRETVVSKERVIPLLDVAVRNVERAGATIVCVLCTGEFPPLGSRALVIYPDRVLGKLIDAILPDGALGVLMPHAGQRETMLAKWSTPRRAVVTGVASPYTAAGDIARETRRLEDAGAQLVVLDCMGFNRAMLADARRATTPPVVLANGLVGATLAELTGLSARLLDQV